MEVILQAVQVAGALPLAHGHIVEQVVAAALRLGSRHLCLGENPLKTLDGEAAHILYGVCSGHDDIHTGETAHRTYIYHIVLCLAVAKPCGHEVLKAVHGCRGNGRLLVGFGDAQVKGGETLVLA